MKSTTVREVIKALLDTDLDAPAVQMGNTIIFEEVPEESQIPITPARVVAPAPETPVEKVDARLLMADAEDQPFEMYVDGEPVAPKVNPSRREYVKSEQ